MDGHLPLQVSWCEHGNLAPCQLLPERFFMAFPLGVTDFSKLNWMSMPPQARTELLRQILQSIANMHDAGLMHRDISLKNMLLVAQDPPLAALIDYGKSVRAVEHDDTRIGPIPTVAPEVSERRVYTNKVDVWSWAYAVAEIYGYSFRPLPGEELWITPKRLARVQKHLQSLPAKEPSEQKLLELAMQALIWDPTGRPTARAALVRGHWDTVDSGLSSIPRDSPSPGSKRIKEDELSRIPQHSASSSVPTATDILSRSPEYYLTKRIKVEEETG